MRSGETGANSWALRHVRRGDETNLSQDGDNGRTELVSGKGNQNGTLKPLDGDLEGWGVAEKQREGTRREVSWRSWSGPLAAGGGRHTKKDEQIRL